MTFKVMRKTKRLSNFIYDKEMEQIVPQGSYCCSYEAITESKMSYFQ